MTPMALAWLLTGVFCASLFGVMEYYGKFFMHGETLSHEMKQLLVRRRQQTKAVFIVASSGAWLLLMLHFTGYLY